MAKMRILSLDPAGLLWGSERALLDFIAEMPETEVACCCPPKTPLVDKLQAAGVRCHPTFQANLHLRGLGARLLALLGLLRAMLAFRPDVLHVNQAGASRIALCACRLLRVPCVVHVRLREDVEYLAGLRASARYLRALVAISDPIAGLIAARPELAGIPCRMLLDAYRPASGGEVAASGGRWDLVCVGRFSESKGQELLLGALAECKRLGAVPRVALVGEINAHARHCQAVAKALGVESSVEFLGHSDRVGEILRQSRWLVCPSGYEPLGRVLFEAWDYGIPVIAAAGSGGAAASIGASGGGLLFAEWTAGSLAATVKQALEIPGDEAARMGARGRDWLVTATAPGRYAAAMAECCAVALADFRKTR